MIGRSELSFQSSDQMGGVIASYESAAAPTPQLPFYPMMFNHTTPHVLLICSSASIVLVRPNFRVGSNTVQSWD